MSTFSKYLGLPLIRSRSKSVAFGDIQIRIDHKISGWKSNLLSQAGRTMLIKSIAAFIPIYGMSSMLLPQSICHKIDSQFRRFWWGFKKDQSRHLTLHAWSKICSPKSEGGLGIKPMQEFNLALISKLVCFVSSPNPRPWVQFHEAKYLRNTEFMHLLLTSRSVS